MLTGYRTYICMGIGVIAVTLHAFGIISDAEESSLFALCGFGGIAALRAAIANSVEKKSS